MAAVEMVATILKDCVRLQQLIENMYQIVWYRRRYRGGGNAGKTATAQVIKAQFGSVRIRERQRGLARFGQDVIRTVGEISLPGSSPRRC